MPEEAVVHYSWTNPVPGVDYKPTGGGYHGYKAIALTKDWVEALYKAEARTAQAYEQARARVHRVWQGYLEQFQEIPQEQREHIQRLWEEADRLLLDRLEARRELYITFIPSRMERTRRRKK